MRRALGRGLSQLVAEQFDSAPTDVEIRAIQPNTRQPRTHFDDQALEELAASIREFGIIQPLLVKPISEGRYELIAGERRLRAAKLAGLTRVPVTVRSAGDQASLELALIENIQREDINAIECAKAYRRLMDEFDLTQEQVADKVGKSRTAVANTVRLLKLAKPIADAVQTGTLSEGHARALLAFESEAHQLAVFDQITSKALTVRDVESLSKRQTKPVKKQPKPITSDPNLAEVESFLSMRLGAPVNIEPGQMGGKIAISYYSDEDLQRILEAIGLG